MPGIRRKRQREQIENAIEPQNHKSSAIPPAKKQKRRSGHILRAQTVPDGDSYMVIDIVYR